MEKIKLVIWDLDETFWKGTLSEEGISPIQHNIELVKELNNRGIINSIVSKNDFEQAKNKLIELGIWDYFVFPAINIIEKCQLRDVNVLFLDDNHLNLEEAKFYNPNLHVHFPDFIDGLLTHKAFVGKNDLNHTRLNQYKILEKKNSAQQQFTSNIEFLRSSNIQLEIITELAAYKDRIAELIERTNQLNFTKIRSNLSEIEALLEDENFESAIIKVKDNYGDYGIVGFYSLDVNSKSLKHFIFSCRILNLGVAQYIYAKLDFPKLNIVQEVAENLDDSSPNWITEITSSDNHQQIDSKTSDKNKIKLFFKGGCDLGQMLFYLEDNVFEIAEETNYMSSGNFPIHQEHSQILLDSLNLSPEDKEYVEQDLSIPFVDEKFYKTKVFEADFDCLIYSVLMDYSNEIYEHKTRKIKLPFGGYSNIWTQPANHETIVKTLKARKINSVNQETLNTFSNNFNHLGQISPEEFITNLKELRNLIPSIIPIIFVNGAEVSHPNPLEKNAYKRHIA